MRPFLHLHYEVTPPLFCKPSLWATMQSAVDSVDEGMEDEDEAEADR